jgi:hypothetical protein
MKYTITSVIPVMQYGNIQPSIEVEAETFEEAQALVEPKMLALWQKYNPGVLVQTGNRQKLTAFVGGEIYYDDAAHVYTNEGGDVYLSGSKYAEQFRKPFDKQKIAGLMAAKVDGATPEAIVKMWELKSQVSMDFGNAIHKALQLYEQYNGLATALEKTTHQHDHPVIKKAVEGFIDAHKGEVCVSEALIVDHASKCAGQVDRLVILDEKQKLCRIEDFKTNADIAKDLAVYWKQLEFYGRIMTANGWAVEPPVIHHYDGSWHTFVWEAQK